MGGGGGGGEKTSPPRSCVTPWPIDMPGVVMEAQAPIRVTHVIFDMDGLLLDSERLYTRAYSRVFGWYGQVFTSDLKARLMGLSEQRSTALCLSECAIPLSADEFTRAIRAEQMKEFPHAELMPGAQEIVDHLHHAGIPMAVATSSKKLTYQVKTKRHQERTFSKMLLIVNGDDPAVREGKPAPDIFLEAAKRAGAAPADCLAFEDSANGVRAALAAGMRVIWIPDPELDYQAEHGDLFTHGMVHRYESLTTVDLALFGLPPLGGATPSDG